MQQQGEAETPRGKTYQHPGRATGEVVSASCVKQLILLEGSANVDIQTIRHNYRTGEGVVEVVDRRRLFTRRTYYSFSHGEVCRVAGWMLFCGACVRVRTFAEGFYGLTIERRMVKFCRSCKLELVSMSQLTLGFESTLQHYQPGTALVNNGEEVSA